MLIIPFFHHTTFLFSYLLVKNMIFWGFTEPRSSLENHYFFHWILVKWKCPNSYSVKPFETSKKASKPHHNVTKIFSKLHLCTYYHFNHANNEKSKIFYWSVSIDWKIKIRSQNILALLCTGVTNKTRLPNK